MGAEPDQDGSGELLAGRYEVGPLVGLGGTAHVYRGWDRHAGRTVALKMFRPGSAPSPGHGGARELRVLDGLSHPGVVGVRGSGVDAEGSPFVVMDFVDGTSLAARLDDGPLPPADVARLGVVLADALAVVHAHGVVHRDVKPANVLLDADDRPWLTDFGIARIVDATRVTATGLVVGTAAYMAPEQVRGEPVGPPADVYALGLVLLEAATGRREYEGNALESALARLHRAPVVPADVPDPLAEAVRRMTVLDPDRRPTAADVAAVLRGRPAAVPAASRARSVGRRTVVRRVVPVAALGSLVAAALTGALTLTGASAPAEPATVVAAAPPVVPPAASPQAPVAAPVEALVVPAEPPVPVAVTRRATTPSAGRPAPVVTRRAAPGRATPADDERDARRGEDRRGDDRAKDRDEDRDENDRGAADRDDESDDKSDEKKDDRGGKSGKSGKDKGEDGDGGHGKGGRSGSNSGKG